MRGEGLRLMLRALADLVSPRFCVVCEKALTLHEDHICAKCLSDLPLTYFWNRKDNLMAEALNAALLSAGVEGPYAYAAALFFYTGALPYKNIPQMLKYMGAMGQGRFFASMLAQRLRSCPHFADVDVVVPVPLHWTRRYSRGYNQAEVISRELARILGCSMNVNILRRRRRTRTQVRLGGAGRSDNVRGAFAVNNRYLNGRGFSHQPVHILLVDDVFTTGATSLAAISALRTCFGPGVRISFASLAFVSSL